ncbi:MAG: UDP-N-acetylmuramate--L-alanine ligase [Thermotoga sp. 50_1627]|nr:MAG: UDP-N-acetylmuramate--L-alanine ligase [Thermotoga sp. 50_64]KUK25434.1 MAG: UDP-N-acetylmuramate--L-alanine ligase [Thermotoga sp. 50_1627]HBT39575.1 UDP-N-acetylmuramate--L-alanine ligase [Pseudothermotoga sp.]HCO98789.1 UDP-N-acetylmuramate--L-alanine ligase [Pseudothermotoga sp.]
MKIHFVGIGGVGMSSLAIHCHMTGHDVYGSDILRNEHTEALEKLGVKVFVGHSRENWLKPDLLVHTPAVSANNPELLRAREENVRIITRFELLRQLVEGSTQFAVTGSDGKTTTTAMLAHVLKATGADPTVFLGGMNPSLEFGNYRKGSGPFVYELDESQPSFSIFQPTHLIITNARRDHLENFHGDELYYLSCFEKLAKSAQNVVTFHEDRLTSHLGHHTFGLNGGTCVLLDRETERFEQVATIRLNGKTHTLRLRVPGLHNVLNAMAVVTLLWAAGFNPEDVIGALSSFVGTYRRFTVTTIDESKNIYVVDDYAHTPEEIAWLIRTSREVFTGLKQVMVFQPHRYTRLAREDGNFARALMDADEIYVTEVYGAFEQVLPNVSARMIVDGLKHHGKKAEYVPSPEELLKKVKPAPNTVYLFVGAGDIIDYSKRFILESIST